MTLGRPGPFRCPPKDGQGSRYNAFVEFRSLLLRRVVVRSFGASTEMGDEGTLRYLDEKFVVIENDKKETMVLPTRNVRLIKVLPPDDRI